MSDYNPTKYFSYRHPVVIILVLVLILTFGHSAHSAVFPRTYDADIQRATKMYMPGVPWRLYKAQLWQESRLDPDARSPAGAEGIAQFMPGTWADIAPHIGAGTLMRNHASAAIQAGAYYMASLRRSWSAPRPEDDRHRLALASYNAGLGNILAAQRACADPVLYEAIMACLPRITGRHAAETLDYAPRIYRWFHIMVTT